MTVTDVPTQVAYGQAVGHFVAFLGDAQGSPPDEIPLTGSVLLTPLVAVTHWPSTMPPRLAVAEPILAPVINGDLCAPGATDNSSPGVSLMATDQPGAQPNLVQWRAVFKLGSNIAPVTFEVPTNGTVDLTMVANIPAQPGTVTVVSHEDALAAAASADQAALSASQAADSAASVVGAEDAADRAEAAATSAEADATTAAQAADSATASASQAGGSATTAATSASTAEAAATQSTTNANEAATSASQAGGSATQAATSASQASASQTAAATSATNAATSATNAGTSATAAAGSATNAANSAAIAGAYFKTVATSSALPAASANQGQSFYVIDTQIVVISDGTRWRTVYGDTGVRKVNSWDAAGVVTGDPLPAGWKGRTGQPGGSFVRRTNNTVFWNVSNLACALANTSDIIWVLPNGFRPATNAIVTVMQSCWTSASANKPMGLSALMTGIQRGSNFAPAVDDYFPLAALSWSTSDPWPTTLPGSVVTPPN